MRRYAWRFGRLEECDKGYWCNWTDVSPLESELAAMKSKLEKSQAELAKYRAVIEALNIGTRLWRNDDPVLIALKALEDKV